MRVLKIRLHEIIVYSCTINDLFLKLTKIILLASSTINYNLWLYLDDRYYAFDQRLPLPHSYIISSTTNLAYRLTDLWVISLGLNLDP